MSKLFSLHGGSLLKPPSPLKQGRHSLGIRNGGLDFVKAAVRLSIGHGDCLLNDGFFSFAVARQMFVFYSIQCYLCFSKIILLVIRSQASKMRNR